MPHAIRTSADKFEEFISVNLVSDSEIDLLSTSVRDNQLSQQENDQSQNFNTQTISKIQIPYRVSASHLDGDGDLNSLSRRTGM